MDISSLLERTPQSPSPDNVSSASLGGRNGYFKRSAADPYPPALHPMIGTALQPPFNPHQPNVPPMLSRFNQSLYQPQQYAPPMASYHPHPAPFGSLPPIITQERRGSIRSLPLAMPQSLPGPRGPTNKRLAPSGTHSGESPAKKKQSKWSSEEDASIIELRGDGMKWEDISKHLPGRSAISCRLRFQNYLERRSEWDDEKKNKLARLYERFVDLE